MECSFFFDKKDLRKALFRFLQPSGLLNSRNFSCDFELSLCARLEMPSLSTGFQIISHAVKFDNSIHHFVCIIGIGAGLAYEKCGSEMVAALWLTEISSPFLHLREFLKELGYKDTDLNLVADVMAVGLQLVSAFWFYKIAKMVKYKLTRRSASRELAQPHKQQKLN
ncbi:hypothetical protein U1Q18_016132 [Sarracenia purpurea var. burkii]